MAKTKPYSQKDEIKRLNGYYALIAKACSCTRSYVRQVLTQNMGTYKGKLYTQRNTILTQQIIDKAKELETFLNMSNKKNKL
jgi:hypothetical protein